VLMPAKALATITVKHIFMNIVFMRPGFICVLCN